MLFLLFSFLLAASIVATGFFLRNTNKTEHSSNRELEKFYSLGNEPVIVQSKQLVLAAKETLQKLNKIAELRESVSELFEEQVVSDRFFRKFRDAEEELIVEKTIVENEAEALRPGAKEQIFAEAGKSVNLEMLGSKKKQIFDEALFLKKQETLMKAFKASK